MSLSLTLYFKLSALIKTCISAAVPRGLSVRAGSWKNKLVCTCARYQQQKHTIKNLLSWCTCVLLNLLNMAEVEWMCHYRQPVPSSSFSPSLWMQLLSSTYSPICTTFHSGSRAGWAHRSFFGKAPTSTTIKKQGRPNRVWECVLNKCSTEQRNAQY